MSDVKPIGKQGITPRVLLESLHKDIDEVTELMCVAFTKEGEPLLYISGQLSSIPYAAFILNEYLHCIYNGHLNE